MQGSCARPVQKARARPAQGLRKVRARPAQDPRKARARPAQGPHKARPKPVLKKTSVSQMIDLVMTIQSIQESSKSELSSRFLSTSKFGPPRKTSAQGHARLFAQGQGWLIFSINYCSVIIRPVKFIENKNENENKNATGEDTYAGALRAPRRFPRLHFCFCFHFR